MSNSSNRQNPGTNADLAGIKILAVEDHVDSLELLTEALQMLGATVVPAASSREAFELLQQHQPHLVISDLGLPDEDGFSLMRRIRRLDAAQGGATPAIALSAFTTAEARKQALEAGFHAFLPKPMELGQLAITIFGLASRRD
jgi:CheY-like chemotaxis protein